MSRRAALVVAPGRGVYNKEELGYLARRHADKPALIAGFDAARTAAGRETLSALDAAARFSAATHTRGDVASGLIYACAYADFLSIDAARFDVVAVTGNSMGWYIALACAGALDAAGGFEVVETMGALMQEAMIGGQLIYPVVDAAWRALPERRAEVMALIEETPGLHLSIDLGGMLVLAGDAEALTAAEARLPRAQERYPMRLPNHAGFHSPLQAPVSSRGFAALPPALFGDPRLPLIDGRGGVWRPRATDPAALRDYTLGAQVVAPYDFAAAIRVAVREYAPETVIVLGPGETLGGATAQALIRIGWRGLASKADFAARQEADPILLAMGRAEQRARVVAA